MCSDLDLIIGSLRFGYTLARAQFHAAPHRRGADRYSIIAVYPDAAGNALSNAHCQPAFG